MNMSILCACVCMTLMICLDTLIFELPCCEVAKNHVYVDVVGVSVSNLSHSDQCELYFGFGLPISGGTDGTDSH